MAEIAGEGPEAAKSVALALRLGAAGAFRGEALLAAADRIDARAGRRMKSRSSPPGRWTRPVAT